MPAIYITAPGERPDFRVVIAFLWHDGQDVDTDGDAEHPASRSWTELYVQNRERKEETVDVSPYQESPLALRVESGHLHLAARVAFFLAESCGGAVTNEFAEECGSPDVLLPLMGTDFDVAEAMRRAANSPFVRASLQDPYPNLG